MDDTGTDTDLDQAEALTALPLAAFDDLRLLLKLIVDERACSKRMASLRAATIAAEKALADLGNARAELDRFIAAERGDLEAQSVRLREREAKIAAADGNLQHREQVLAARLAALDLRTGRVRQIGGITRVFEEDFPDQVELPADAHSRDPADDDALQVPIGSTLTRGGNQRSTRGARIR